MRRMDRKLRVLVFLDHYLPGIRFGGIATAVASMVEVLGAEIDFFVVTANYDAHSTERYPGIVADNWTQVGKACVFYTANHSASTLKRVLAEARPDVVHLNSFFSHWTRRVLWLRKRGVLPRTPVVIAPRGTLSEQALAIKAMKKRALRLAFDAFGLDEDVLWHATSEHEAADIQRYRKCDRSRVLIAPDLMAPLRVVELRSSKQRGRLRIVAISRIAPIKNFDFLIEALRSLEGEITLDLYGSIDDEAYWRRCQHLTARHKPSIRVRFRGVLGRHEITNTLQEYDLHALPSKGENFGYSVAEALGAGVPVLVSDRTPWRGLEQANAGWTLPLHREQWTERLQHVTDMNADEHERMRLAARAYFRREVVRPEHIDAMRALFAHAIR
jgi:glycosyltransferase involved in cell wall biosynthesis